ncbi:MAG TPA: FG-GAP-like repeat-containing protein [Verrucomicrobiae bacterium]
MKTKLHLLAAGMLLATAGTGLGQAPVITVQPTNLTVCVGTDAHFNVGATGAAPLAYQWQKAPNFLDFTAFPGGTTETLVITNVQLADVADYRVIITNLEGAVTSSYPRLYLAMPPLISASGQPTNWPDGLLGGSVGNRVVATGTQPLTYQWRLNGSSISSQTRFSIVLTNLQTADAGDYDVVVANMCGSVTSRVVKLTVHPPHFESVLQPGWTNQNCYSWAVAWGDYNGDGYQDLFVSNADLSGGGPSRSFLYRNNGLNAGARPFTQMTTNDVGEVAGDVALCYSSAWIDVNNDGLLDLFVARFPLNASSSVAPRLYLNQGNGKLVSVPAGALTARTFGWGGPWGDYDNDGFLDHRQLSILIASGWPTIRTNRLLRGKPDCMFEQVVDSPVVTAQTDNSNSSAWADYNNDGNLDLIDVNPNRLTFFFQNQGNGKFVQLTNAVTPATPPKLNPAWGDYDNDGDLDLLLVGGFGAGSHPSYLFRNDYPNDFVQGFDFGPGGYASWADYDNDGWLDVVIVSGQSISLPNSLFHNNGDGTFTSVNEIVTTAGYWVVGAWGDYDNDGAMDLFVTSARGGNVLFHNLGSSNHWIKFNLKGTASNAAAIGAKVRVRATIRGQTIWQMREIQGAPWPQDDPRPNFGLGDATTAELVRIEWPSGIIQTLTNLAADQILPVVEHQDYGGPPPAFAGAAIVTNGIQLSITEPDANTRYVLEASTNLASWTKLLARTSAGGTTQFTDARATNNTRRFYRLQVP